MQFVNNFSMSVCIIAILSSIFEFLSPAGNMKKIMQFVIAIFVIFSLSFPILNGVNNFNLNLLNITQSSENSEINSSINDLYIKTSEEKINKLVDKTLRENEISAENIETNMDINEDGSIDINIITIYLNKTEKDKSLKAKSIVKNQLNLNCEIKISGE